jgi:hypothetical protein
MLILKQNAANTVPTPPAGKGTLFLNTADDLNVKTSDGNIATFPTASGSNTQVYFNDENSFGATANFTFNKTTNVLTITGNVAATRVLTDNLLYANGTSWDLSDPGGANTQIQFNDDESFGGSAAFVFDKSSNLVTVSANLNSNNLNATTHITSGNVWANSGIIGAQTLKGEGGNISNIQGGNVSGAVSSATSATTAGTVTTAAQPNITSTGTLTALTVTGNISAGNVSATTFTGALSGAATSATTAGTVTTAAQPNITSVGTLTSLGVTGNISSGNANLGNAATANFFIGSGNNLSNIQGANVTGTVATATTAGTVTTAAQPNITSVGTLSALTVTGNVGAGNVSATTFTGALTGNASGSAATVTTAAQPNITSVGTLTALTVTGNISSGNATLGNAATANFFIGSGNNLSNIQGANVTGAVATATTAGTVTTAAQPNITSVGTLTSLGVSGTITAPAFTANTGVFTGNGSGLSAIAGANVTGAVAFATTANAVAGANVSGQVANALVSGTVYTAAQPNITSVGTLTSATVTGNVAAGNLTTTGVLSVTGTGVSSIAGNLDMTSNTIINLATPTNSTDAATKQYVDDVAQGLNIHASCNAATQTTLASISGGTVTYNNGTAGVGATLTTTGSYTTIDGVTLSDGMRILVKNEVTTANNGIYVRTSATVLTRATDFDTAVEIAGGDFTFVTAGTLYNSTGWVQIDEVTTVGTDPIVWEQFSGAGTYQAGTGLTLTGSTFSVNASQTQVTAVGTLTGLNSSGTITAPAFTANTGVFTGNGAGLTNIAGANVTGTVSSATTAGTVTTAAQPNITSVGTLTSLGVTGTTTSGNFATAGNITASFLVSNIATGTAPLTVTSTTRVANLNVAQANLADFISVAAGTGNNFLIFANAATGNITELTSTGLTANLSNNSITATTFVGALSGAATSATTAGTVTTAAQPNITSVGTLTSLAVTGNISAGNVSATTFTGALTGAATTAGTVTTAAQPNITSVSTSFTGLTFVANAQISMSGAGSQIDGVNLVSANSFSGNGSSLTALNATNISSGTLAQARLANASVTLGSTALTLGSTVTTVAGLSSVTSTTFVGALTGAATTAGTVTTAAQPNITSVGTLTGLTLANASVISVGSNTNVGTFTGNFSLSAGSRLNATYADIAEKYVADATYEPGTVLLFGGEHEVTLSTAFDSTKVAGVVTTNPAYSMNSALEAEYVAEIALQGRVPVKVTGTIAKGDLLVSASNGHAVANNEARAGTIIGKSLENFTGESGVIEVAVGRF